ncbi:DUF1566 domain-containing protein [Leptospira levettii]|uniref:Lcl domain-containing protein n=1 Tax=Leptospira levettii TaxID=2023178 RepID=UPI001083A0BA|nr:DUF1566 domain-containing protein [Leptospira levettii]TGM66434.1 DUF1566 domain-containing protein [Leptospira levettii]
MKISNFFSKLEIQFFPYILLVTSLSFCKNPSLENPCDPNYSVYYEILLSKIFSGNMGNHCGANINKVIAPIFFPSPGHYTEPNFITITTITPGATIYITTDGTTPNSLSTPYLSPSSIWRLAGQRIRAIATKVGMEESAISEGTYSILPLKTGQTTSYTVGDDASIGSGLTINYAEPKVDQIFPNDYTTIDQSTGIIWKTCSEGLSGPTCAINSPGVTTGGLATLNTSCLSLNSANSGKGYSGYTTWRLPTMRELLSTNDASKTSVTILNPTALPGTVNYAYWASTPYPPSGSDAWYLDYSNSNSYATTNSNPYHGRCVASLPPVETLSYQDNGDGTIKDNTTGLFWQKCSYGQNNDAGCTLAANSINWSGAITYCSGLSLSGKVWRLPNRNELISLHDYTKSVGPKIDQTIFPNTVSFAGGYYWTSTTNAPGTTNAWYVNFTTTFNNIYDVQPKSNSLYVRCVSQ